MYRVLYFLCICISVIIHLQLMNNRLFKHGAIRVKSFLSYFCHTVQYILQFFIPLLPKRNQPFSGGISRDRGLLIEGEGEGASPDERWMKLG